MYHAQSKETDMNCKPEVDAHTEECIKGTAPCDAEMERWSAEAYAEMDAEAARDEYEDDRLERTRAGSALQGVCKDCGNGTLNNDLNPAFGYNGDEDQPYNTYACIACGSTHLDIF
jgi:hypothetical protein